MQPRNRCNLGQKKESQATTYDRLFSSRQLTERVVCTIDRLGRMMFRCQRRRGVRLVRVYDQKRRGYESPRFEQWLQQALPPQGWQKREQRELWVAYLFEVLNNGVCLTEEDGKTIVVLYLQRSCTTCVNNWSPDEGNLKVGCHMASEKPRFSAKFPHLDRKKKRK